MPRDTWIVVVMHETMAGNVHRYEDGPYDDYDDAKAARDAHVAMKRKATIVTSAKKPAHEPPKQRSTRKLQSEPLFDAARYASSKRDRGSH